jgi:peptidoglycan/xylan/chitin deacetylase (PgdA/CDA1 family)
MPWATLPELASRGVEIGSHSVSHPHLPQLTDAELRRELVDSREQIEAEVGRPCRFLAYPYGDDDARVHAAARNAGYRAAYTLRRTGGRRSPSRSDASTSIGATAWHGSPLRRPPRGGRR